ncbi:hypothetical protein [Arenibacter certesii]|uniref:DUF4134 domain-containing protein n=1 Tax=Arenibacter certesii TaxID=228955 RepID=A0A918IMK3_9FLAO|nr:hypothetical protein [Arenibacter certesii]GGW22866.1 hypothetical protein GCM10007383_03420 [Arenibacter certesii]
MRSILLLLALLLVNSQIAGQTKEFSKDYFLQKSKKQNTTGWILLGGGTAMVIGGITAFNSSWDSGSNSSADIGGVFVLVGILADGASIPYFISAANNKKTAMSITFDYKPIYLPGESLVATKPYSIVSLKIKLDR